jgi:hypothetical protein
VATMAPSLVIKSAISFRLILRTAPDLDDA